MFWGPFQTKEAGEIIMIFSKDKLLPAITDLEKFAIKVANHKTSFTSSFFQKNLNKLNSEYKEKYKNIFTLYHLYSTPDELFKDLKEIKNDPQSIKIVGSRMADYFNSKQAILNSFEKGFKLLEIIEHQLDRYFQSADNRISITLSIFAITISIIGVIYQ